MGVGCLIPRMVDHERARVFRPVAKIQAIRLDRMSSRLRRGAGRARARFEPGEGVTGRKAEALYAHAMSLDTGRHEPVALRLPGGNL